MSWLRSKPASATGKPATRRAHSIRYLETEWERIEAFAEDRGLTPSEFVRFATLAAIEDGASLGRLAPLVKTTFRATYMMMSRLSEDLLEGGETEKLESLVADAEEVQEELLGGAEV